MIVLYRPINILVILVSISFVGCGGGGGGSSSSDSTTTVSATKISGKATTPSGMISQFDNKPVKLAFIDYFISSAAAALTGITPVANTTVDLIRIDDTGVQIGPSLATTTTDASGNYSLDLPSGVDFSGDLVVQISGATEVLRAIVTDTSVDINLLSEIVLGQTIDAGEDLSTLDVGRIEALIAGLEASNIQVTAVTIADAIAEIEAANPTLIEFIGDQIAVAASSVDDGTAAASIVGGWNVVQAGIDLLNEDNLGIFGADIERSAAPFSLTSPSIGTIDISQNLTDFAFAEFVVTPGNVKSIIFESGDDEPVEDPPLSTSISSEGVLTLTLPQEVEFTPGEPDAKISPPRTLRFFPVGDNILLNFRDESSAIHAALDSDEDGISDAIGDKIADEGGFDMTLLLRAGSSASVTDLNGNYGMVAISQEINASSHDVDGTVGEFTLVDGLELVDANAFEVISVQSSLDTPTSTPLAVNTFTEPALSRSNRNWVVTANGLATYAGTIEGAATPDGSILAWTYMDTDNAGTPTFFSHSTLLAVRLGNNMTNALDSQTFQLFSLEQRLQDDGGTRVRMIKSGDLMFNSDSTQVTITASSNIDISRDSLVGQVVRTRTDLPAESGIPTVVNSNGEVSLSGLKGYVSEDSNLLIMRTHDDNIATDGTANLGLVIGIRSP